MRVLASNARVLCVDPGPHFSVADVHRGWRRAFEQLGLRVANLNLGDRLHLLETAHIKRGDRFEKAVPTDAAVAMAAESVQMAAYQWWPHLVFVTSGFFVPPTTLELMRRRGHRTVLLLTESPYEDDRQMHLAPLVDVVLMNDPTNLERFQEANPRSYYMPHAFDPTVHRPGPAEAAYKSDVAFVGTGFASRREFLERVGWDGIDLLLAGNWPDLEGSLVQYLAHERDECLPNDDAVRVYRSTKASFNLYRREAQRSELEQGWAMGPREIELAATGTFFLRDPRPECDQVLPMLPTFRDPEEFDAKLRWYLKHDDAREKSAQEAMAAVQGRTFESNAKQLLRLLESEKR